MHLTIKLPPKLERTAIVDAFIEGFLQDSSFTQLYKIIQKLVDAGYERNGILCMVMHRSTYRVIRLRMQDFGKKENMDAAFCAPISLN